MKFKLLLLVLVLSSILLKAQEPYRNLIFSEVRIDQAHHAYLELCNMGDVSVDLAQFELGKISPWDDPYIAGDNSHLMLPSRMLNPGETYVVAIVREWANEEAKRDIEAGRSNTKADTWRLADLKLHAPESPNNDPTDSITPGYGLLDLWGGTYCLYIRHHYMEGDSIVTDAVNGVFTGDNGRRPDGYGPSDVAGVPDATVNSILVRKSGITTGNLDWEQARGVDIDDSEWLPVPILNDGGWEMGRKEYWTVGNHGDYKLDESTLTSETIDIDWANMTLTCQWGARNQDSIMNEFNFAPGIAWKYQMSPEKLDSAYTSVRTGDSITLYACGNQLAIMKFAIVALEPTADEARVIPKNANNGGGWYTPFIVSEGLPGMDTISNVGFATRVDTLYKYLEKAPGASMEITWVDGTERPDLMDGDILKVTSESGSVTKEYYVKVTQYIPSHNANLSSITWPDIPEFYKGIFGWKGDTIPNFSPTKFNYTVQVPYDVDGIPALIARPENTDTKIEVKRASSLFGSEEDKTIKFFTTAEDDTTLQTYSVKLEKEKDLSNVQPYEPEPFFSQWVFRADWRQFFLEICNPGNQDLDLSRYCIVRANMNPVEAISANSGVDNFANRYNRYVPGYVWQDEAQWLIQPSILEQDLGVDPIVKGGDVFVLAWAFPNYKDVPSRDYPGFDQIDVNFKNGYNPWGIEFPEDELATDFNICGGWYNSSWYLYKIVNDSVLNGLKPLADPYDVEIIDVIGRCDGTSPGSIDGVNFDQNSGMIRLPQYYKGNVEPGGSFGTGDPGTAEWLYTYANYWVQQGYGWPENNSMNSDGIGSHEMVTITEFISTVASSAYTVSDGYSMDETIGGGVQQGITVAEFMANIIIADPAQVLTFTSNGTELNDGDVLTDGDLLTVVSANGDNTTRYTINVTVEGLDSNALLTSDVYTVEVLTDSTGTVSGFDAGTTLEEVYSNVTAPSNASLFGAFNSDGSYATFTAMRLDSTYYDVAANDQVYFEVIAQDGKTRMEYQLVPNSLESDAYVLSTIYAVDQDAALISLVPGATNVSAFLGNLIPAPGATLKLVNKIGQERTMGTIYEDDQVVVTAKDGATSKTYSIEFWRYYAIRYDANLFSDTWQISLQTLRIDGATPLTTVEEFLADLRASMGATFELLDADGNPISTGDMEDDFTVVVTSENGLVVKVYRVVLDHTGVEHINGSSIVVYPNPTSGLVNITGLEEGQTVSIYNTVGYKVMQFDAETSTLATSLDDHPSGMYFVVVNQGAQRVAQFKMIKK